MIKRIKPSYLRLQFDNGRTVYLHLPSTCGAQTINVREENQPHKDFTLADMLISYLEEVADQPPETAP